MITQTVQDFYHFLQKQMPIIAIDYGKKKMGIAISTPDLSMPLPLCMITLESEKKKITNLLEIIKEKNICGIVIGLPVNMDGSESEQTNSVKKFAQKLEKRTNLPIFFQDERLTSKAADSFLSGFGLNRKQRNESDDLAAASMILETTLELIKKV